MDLEKLKTAASKVAIRVIEMHEDHKKGQWNANCGQWLVYGFERDLGFLEAADFEAAIERHWVKHSQEGLEEVISNFLIEFAKRKKK